jgi:hypothetical protein
MKIKKNIGAMQNTAGISHLKKRYVKLKMRNYERDKNELILKGSHFITYLYHKQKLY